MILLAACLQLAIDVSSPPIEYQGFPQQDALSYKIDINFDFEAATIDATAQLSFRLDEATEYLKLHSLEGDNWGISFSSPSGEALTFTRQKQIISVDLGGKFSAGSVVNVVAKMQGSPPDGLYFEENRYGQPVFFTDHFSSRARGWLPCEDHPSDRAEFSVRINTKEKWEIIASGAQQDSPNSWRTETDLPTYMLAFAAGPYARIKESGDDRFIPHFIYRKDKAIARLGLKHHAKWMKSMEENFGPYAWEKYCVVQVPTRWGGMENAGNTWIMERLFDGHDRGVGTLAHEFAHMWFGNAAGYLDWHDAWLSEGFATYFGPWLHAQVGGPPLVNAMVASRRRWSKSACAFTRPIRWFEFSKPDDFFASSAPNTYQKAAWVLHMLRAELGDQDFFAGISAYYQSISSAATTTAVFQQKMSEQAGRPLNWFFDQWLNRPGCPQLSFDWQESTVVITQHQDLPYRFKLKLAWTDAAGEKKLQVFEIDQAVTAIDLGGKFSTPQIDPQTELLWSKPRKN